MKIEELTIADLKAAYDFILEDLKMLEETAKEKGIQPQQIGAYNEVKTVEDKVYNELLNRTRGLK